MADIGLVPGSAALPSGLRPIRVGKAPIAAPQPAAKAPSQRLDLGHRIVAKKLLGRSPLGVGLDEAVQLGEGVRAVLRARGGRPGCSRMASPPERPRQ